MNILAFVVLQAQAMSTCALVPPDHLETIEAHAATDVDAAIARAAAVRSQAPGCAGAHLAYALALNVRLQRSNGLSALRRAREYRSALDRTLELEPTSQRALRERIEFFMYAPSLAGGSAERARRDLVALAELDLMEAARLSVELERRSGDEMAALAALERYADLAPGNPTVILLAQRLARLERFREADLRLIGLAADTGDVDERSRVATPYLRGRIRVLGDFEPDAAVAFLTQYIEGGGPRGLEGLPSLAVAHFRLGEAEEQRGRCEAARSRYEDAARLDPSVEGLKEAQRRVGKACAPP